MADDLGKCVLNGREKVIYPSHDAALGAVASILRSHLCIDGQLLNAYQCRLCGGWHVGHRLTREYVRRRYDVSRRTGKPVAPPDPLPRCECACKKAATETVTTRHGEMKVCAHHAQRLREARIYA